MQLMYKDLEDLLTRRKKLISWGEAVTKWKDPKKQKIKWPLVQLLNGLRTLHAEGITHRDLKPRVSKTITFHGHLLCIPVHKLTHLINGKNILLDSEYNVKIADFGVSKQARNRVQTTMATNTGTTGYTAPEVLRTGKQFHGNYTPKADLWSLGCVVYRMIKGEQILEHDDETKREAENKVKALAENDWEGFESPETNLLKKLLCIDPEKRSAAKYALESYRKSSEL